MLKIISCSIILLVFINKASAQKYFNINIKLDTSINPQKVSYEYNDGKSEIFIPDTCGNKRDLIFKGAYFSPLASFEIIYSIDPLFYSNIFFIDNNPAKVVLYYKPNNDNTLKYSFIKNASPIFDTNTNKIFRELRVFTKKENEELSFYIGNHKKEILGNDPIFVQLEKTFFTRSMLFLRKYPNDYFSFWYFCNQISQVGLFKKDRAFLQEQMAYFTSVFPKKFTESAQGKKFFETYQDILNPLKLNEAVPQFTINTIDGKKIALNELKGKYVLLDFWATWCGPCMSEIPFIKELRSNYPDDKLVIVGISQDRDIKLLNAVIKEHNMNWQHFYDLDNEISTLYGIDEFPALVLINKEGQMIYKSDYIKDDKKELPKLLENLN